MKKVKSLKIIRIILYYLCLFVLYFAFFIRIRFEDISFEQLLFNVTNTEGANYGIVFIGVIFIVGGLALTTFLIFLFYKLYKIKSTKICLDIAPINKIKSMKFIKKCEVIPSICLIIFAFAALFGSYKILKIDEYVSNQKQTSKIFEDYYVDGRKLELKFPKQKRNLIYIYVESMEMSNASIKNGGNVEESYIPKLEKLALENINFSNTNKLGGARQIYNTGWTIAALVAQTSGIPIKLSLNQNSYVGDDKYMAGVYNLGDILKDNGYSNYFMIGSDANFGGRKDYFESHGDYTIYDYIYAKDKELIAKDYNVWWGYEDKKLFKFAKQKILEAVKEGEPFNFTILTVDTHFTDGYMDNSCEEIFDTKYANSIYCSDSKIYSFVNWIKKQDFYENTTIIISGDHLTLQNNFYKDDDYIRTTYNSFINSAIEPINEKNRIFSTLDMFPTTLAALGVKIPGNSLGLGVNLFSDRKTLLEEMGIDYFEQELAKKSFYYDNKLLRDTYYKTKEEPKEI